MKSEIIPISATWGKHPVLSHPESPQGAPLPAAEVVEVCSIICLLICLLIWQVTFFIHKTMKEKFNHMRLGDSELKRIFFSQVSRLVFTSLHAFPHLS